MEKVVATVSGYQGSQRFNLIKLIAKAGGNYVGTMSDSVTHLVCWRFEGRKFELARKSGKTLIVNHRWIEECIKKGRRVQENPYTKQCGEEVGPVLMNLTLASDSNQSSECHSKDPWIDNAFETEESSPDRELFLRPEKRSRTLPETSYKRRRLVKRNTNDVLEISDSEQASPHIQPPPEYERITQSNNERHEGISNNSETSKFSHAENCVKYPTSPELSCVICWTDFSSTRGLLPCGHRFCFSCIQSWADQMVSRGKTSTCPLCKVGFASITKVADALSTDQKIYSQTIPHDRPGTDIYILPDGETSRFPANPAMPPVCCQCLSREPVELLINCHVCQARCIHEYCLDPPLQPWTCIHCKDIQRRYLTYYRPIW